MQRRGMQRQWICGVHVASRSQMAHLCFAALRACVSVHVRVRARCPAAYCAPCPTAYRTRRPCRAAGNIVLTDADHTILTLLRNSKHDADARVTVHDKYPLTTMRELPLPSAPRHNHYQ